MESVPSAVVAEFGDELDTETNMVDVLWPYVAPDMAELRRARQAVLIALASPDDGEVARGRVHVLLHGEEGTGKSVLRNWVKNAYPNALGVGPKSSGAGLKGSMQGGGYTPGALHTAHLTNAPLAIDELDEFEGADRGALLEAMSEGEYDIAQGNVLDTKPAEVRVIAAANRTNHFRDELLDRFDFTIEVTEYDAAETVSVTETLYGTFRDDIAHNQTATRDNPLIEYIQWCRDFYPAVPYATHEEIIDAARWLIEDQDFVGNIRQKEAYYRIGYTIARLNRRDMHPRDFVNAVDLVHDAPGLTSTLLDRL